MAWKNKKPLKVTKENNRLREELEKVRWRKWKILSLTKKYEDLSC